MTKRKASLGLHALKEKSDNVTVDSEGTIQTVVAEKMPKTKLKKKQSIPLYLDPLLHDALHMIVFSERHKKTTFQSLFMEALDLLLKQRGLPSTKQLGHGEKTINL